MEHIERGEAAISPASHTRAGLARRSSLGQGGSARSGEENKDRRLRDRAEHREAEGGPAQGMAGIGTKDAL